MTQRVSLALTLLGLLAAQTLQAGVPVKPEAIDDAHRSVLVIVEADDKSVDRETDGGISIAMAEFTKQLAKNRYEAVPAPLPAVLQQMKPDEIEALNAKMLAACGSVLWVKLNRQVAEQQVPNMVMVSPPVYGKDRKGNRVLVREAEVEQRGTKPAYQTSCVVTAVMTDMKTKDTLWGPDTRRVQGLLSEERSSPDRNTESAAQDLADQLPERPKPRR